MSENIVVRVRKIRFGELIDEALQAEDAARRDGWLNRVLWQRTQWNRASRRDDDIGFVFRRILESNRKAKIGKSTPALLHYTVMVPKTLKNELFDAISCSVDTFIVEILRSLVGPKNILKTRFEEKQDFNFWDFWVFPEKNGRFEAEGIASAYELACFEEAFNDKLRALAHLLEWDKNLSAEKMLSAVVIPPFEEKEDD